MKTTETQTKYILVPIAITIYGDCDEVLAAHSNDLSTDKAEHYKTMGGYYDSLEEAEHAIETIGAMTDFGLKSPIEE